MAVTGMGMSRSNSSYYGLFSTGGVNDPLRRGKKVGHTLREHSEKSKEVAGTGGIFLKENGTKDSVLEIGAATMIPVTAKEYGTPAPYTRCITASIKTQELLERGSSDGQILYSYTETERSFTIFVDSDGHNKKYTIKGMDWDGQEFEREFDPYELDLEAMDYPEFSALCMYIRQTDETADLIAGSIFTDTRYFGGIFDRGDRVELLKQYADENRDTNPGLAALASELFDAIHEFFEKTLWNTDNLDENLSLLFEDRSRIPDTVVTSNTEYTDPETGKKVPVHVRYTTSYTEEGISCRKYIKDGDKESSRELWSLDFKDEADLSKVRELLSGFDDEDRLTFAAQKKFWEDYLSGNMDVEGFKEYYKSTNNGVIDFEGRMADGEKLGDIFSEPYAEYFNNQSFVAHAYTEQELWDDWNAKIAANQKAAKANGAGIVPPAETIVTRNIGSYVEKPVWSWYDGRFGYHADVFRKDGSGSEYTVRLRYDNGREENRTVNADRINASSCNIVDLQVKMAHLQGEGKISQEDYMMEMVIAHFNMENWMPAANENTMVDFRNIFEKQLELEMRNGGNEKHIAGWMNLFRYL